MNKKKLILTGLGTAACAGAGYLYLIAPGRPKAEERDKFQHRYFAHRGLHNQEIPENTLAAFRAAAEQGYGVELDARLTRDGFVVISHDDNLMRMTGQDISIDKSDLEELKQIDIGGTKERIPLLSEALDVICPAGVPVILEVKPIPYQRQDELCRKVLAEIDSRDAAICVESFDPRIVRWFRIHAPHLMRGQLTAHMESLDTPAPLPFILSRLLGNFLGRPQFITPEVGMKGLSLKLNRLMGAMQICWVATDQAQEQKNDAVIFEDFLPPVGY